MTAKEHYENHLAGFYGWMTGNFAEKQEEQQEFFKTNLIFAPAAGVAVDLGAGHGLQSISLANLGFKVIAVDFNKSLLEELQHNGRDLPIETVHGDLLEYLQNDRSKADLIVCMGDTLTHLESTDHIERLIKEISSHLLPGGKVVLSFRDLTVELKNEQRFIPVKSDESRILTCFLEYFPSYVMVHDILHEKKGSTWTQKVSAYPKLRLSPARIVTLLEENNLHSLRTQTINRMVYINGQKAGA